MWVPILNYREFYKPLKELNETNDYMIALKGSVINDVQQKVE